MQPHTSAANRAHLRHIDRTPPGVWRYIGMLLGAVALLLFGLTLIFTDPRLPQTLEKAAATLRPAPNIPVSLVRDGDGFYLDVRQGIA